MSTSTSTAAPDRNSNTGGNNSAPQPQATDAPVTVSRWAPILSSGLTVFGVACAAAYTSAKAADKGVGIAAWVAVAVVGSTIAISTARNSHS